MFGRIKFHREVEFNFTIDFELKKLKKIKKVVDKWKNEWYISKVAEEKIKTK